MANKSLTPNTPLDQPSPFRPQVAAVIDEQSILRVAFRGNVVTRPCGHETRGALARSGAPLWSVPARRRHGGPGEGEDVSLPERLVSRARTTRPDSRSHPPGLRVWCYAPGYQEPHRVNQKAMEELTGFGLVQAQPATARVNHAQTGQQLCLTEGFGVEKPVTPLFAAADASPDETLATYGDDSAAVALRKTDDGWSLFVGPPALSSQLTRLAARHAGVHLYTQTDCNVCANRPFVLVHASQDGPLEIDFGRPGTITDLMSGDAVGQGPTITLPIKPGETRVFQESSE